MHKRRCWLVGGELSLLQALQCITVRSVLFICYCSWNVRLLFSRLFYYSNGENLYLTIFSVGKLRRISLPLIVLFLLTLFPLGEFCSLRAVSFGSDYYSTAAAAAATTLNQQ